MVVVDGFEVDEELDDVDDDDVVVDSSACAWTAWARNDWLCKVSDGFAVVVVDELVVDEIGGLTSSSVVDVVDDDVVDEELVVDELVVDELVVVGAVVDVVDVEVVDVDVEVVDVDVDDVDDEVVDDELVVDEDVDEELVVDAVATLVFGPAHGMAAAAELGDGIRNAAAAATRAAAIPV